MGRRPRRSGPLDLATQDRARRDRDELTGGLVNEIAEHECRFLQPGNHSQRRPIRTIQVVPVPGLPVHERIPVGRVHLHIGAEEIGAEVGPMIEAVLDEELPVTRLPTRRPCMSQTAVTTVSMSSVAMSAARSPTLILPAAVPAMLNPFLALGMAEYGHAKRVCSDLFVSR